MERLMFNTFAYKVSEYWRCDISESSCRDIDTYDAWLYHKDCGIKMFMFGVDVRDCGIEQFKQMVSNLWVDYVSEYTERFMEE
ncbi:MAG: hypothetical protein IKU35_06600 [Bacteroidaceae bacterium]|nr:hypothetical protein [Bacteroidaceae bacterium]